MQNTLLNLFILAFLFFGATHALASLRLPALLVNDSMCNAIDLGTLDKPWFCPNDPCPYSIYVNGATRGVTYNSIEFSATHTITFCNFQLYQKRLD
ncbi:hypothetical protein BH11BAC7_BH11BAC7_12840 [soil metagenome]